MPPEVGDHCPCLRERNRFYTGKEGGPWEEAFRCSSSCCSTLSQKEMGGEVQSKRHRRRINAAVSRGRAGLKEGSGQNGAVLGSAPSPSSSSSERPSGPAIFGRGEDLDNSSVQNQDGKTMSRGYDCISIVQWSWTLEFSSCINPTKTGVQQKSMQEQFAPWR